MDEVFSLISANVIIIYNNSNALKIFYYMKV